MPSNLRHKKNLDVLSHAWKIDFINGAGETLAFQEVVRLLLLPLDFLRIQGLDVLLGDVGTSELLLLL